MTGPTETQVREAEEVLQAQCDEYETIIFFRCTEQEARVLRSALAEFPGVTEEMEDANIAVNLYQTCDDQLLKAWR